MPLNTPKKSPSEKEVAKIPVANDKQPAEDNKQEAKENSPNSPNPAISPATVKGKNLDDVGGLIGSKNNEGKSESLPLPKSEEPGKTIGKNQSNRIISSEVTDSQSILKEDEIGLKTSLEIELELEEEEVAELVAEELKIQENRKTNKWMHYFAIIAAKADVFAAAHTMAKHQVCIYIAFAMIPMSILTITWDVLAVKLFEIPHLSTISAPAFILVINFVAMPLAMYGYMMEYLMHENSREAIIGMICVVVHPILFLMRAAMEYLFDGYRSGMKLYYETPATGEPLEYPSLSVRPLNLTKNTQLTY